MSDKPSSGQPRPSIAQDGYRPQPSNVNKGYQPQPGKVQGGYQAPSGGGKPSAPTTGSGVQQGSGGKK